MGNVNTWQYKGEIIIIEYNKYSPTGEATSKEIFTFRMKTMICVFVPQTEIPCMEWFSYKIKTI